MIIFLKKIKRFLFHIKTQIFIKLGNIFISDKKINPEVIILGYQKSGTTAIASLLALNTNKTITIDPPVLWKGIENVLLNKTTLKEVIYKNKIFFTTQILKEPSLTFISEEVMNLFPNSKYVFIIRNPFDTIRSILNRLDLRGDYDELPNEVFEKIDKNWKPLIKGELYGINDKSYIETLAIMWVKAANVYLNNTNKFILVKYEDFNQDKVKIIENLTKQLGFKSIADIQKSIDKQFQPRGKKVNLKEFFGENNYDKIYNICNKIANKFDY